MEKSRMNNFMYNRPQEDGFTLGVGVRASFQDDDDSISSSSDFEIPDLKNQSSRGDSSTEVGSMRISINGSNSVPSGSAEEKGESESQNDEFPKSTLIPMIGNTKIQQSAPQPSQTLNINTSQYNTHQPNTHGTQNHETYPINHEQLPHLHHQQQYDNFSSVQQLVYTPQYQQSGLNRTFQFPVPMDPRYAQVYQQQVLASPSPQPSVYQLTSQTSPYGQPVLIQPSPLILPQTQIIEQQQWPYREVSCSDTQSVSSVGSSYPSVVSTPVFYGSYYNRNIGSQPIVSPQCYPSNQVIQQNVVPSHHMPPFNLDNAQGCSITRDMKCSINHMPEMTVPSLKPGQPLLEQDAAPVNTEIDVTLPHQNSTKTKPRAKKKGRQGYIHTENFDYPEEKHEKHSNLYVNWTGTGYQLRDVLQRKTFEIHSIHSTSIKDLWNVVFDSHSSAKKAFTTQREIKIRMVPPRRSKKNWLRNPSPKFFVEYEIKCRLDVRQGKAMGKDLVGALLMSRSSSTECKGCHIWADQLKGHRIRVVGCVGKFMFPSKRVIDMKEIPGKDSSSNEPIGWVSYRNQHTRKDYVTRISGNLLQDYIYNE